MGKKKWNKKILKWLIGILITILILLNMFSAVQAYSCTHFKEENSGVLIPDSVKSTTDILKMLVFGVEIPKPKTEKYPERGYESIMINIDEGKDLSAWFIRTDSVSKGLIIYFHGYKDEKSMLFDYAYETLDMGYDAMLVDFMGAGDSYGNQTTIGYYEASNVKAAFDYATNQLGEKNVYLLGFSMGAAAILKAQYDYNMDAKGIIVEASYGKMFDTVKIRLEKTGFLSYPLACMFTFWGGATNGMNAFSMNPENYAKAVTIPTLIACGGKDQYIPKSETQRIFDNLASKNKTLRFYPDCIHEPYLEKYPEDWKRNIRDFLNSTK